jgi:glycosyltransferase involved in cell wall biosynthesis
MKRPLRIAYIDHTGAMGGAEHLLLSLLRLLPTDRIVPFLFCGQDGRLVVEARKLGIQTEFISLPRFLSTSWVCKNRKVLNPFAVLWNGAALLVAAWRLVQKIRKLEIDLIQTNTVFSHIYGGIAARLLKIPCVWYFHDLLEPQRLAGLIAYTWRFLAAVLPYRIIADSQAVLHSLSYSHGKVIYPCVLEMKDEDTRKHISLLQRLCLPADSVLVGMLGRIAYVKGLDILIEAASLVIARNKEIHFVIFGGALFGEEKYKIELEKKVDQAGLSKNWHWMGYDELAKEYLKELGFVVFPSRREAFGLTLVEAGYCGKAVIGTKVGGIPEIIEDGRTGILVPAGDHQALSVAILDLAKRTEYASFLGVNAKERVENLFTQKHYMDEFMEFYSGLSNQPGS